MGVFGKRFGGGRRNANRVDAPLLAVITSPRTTEKATLVNVSSEGALLRSGCAPESDETLFISMDGVKAFGTVRRVSPDEFAVAFDPPLEDEQLEETLCKAARGKGLQADVRALQDMWMGDQSSQCSADRAQHRRLVLEKAPLKWYE